ncbi:MAG: ferritin-like domain-containing protein [Myxococcales bacterium]|nr:ferritin-like domain-containing protein [Myxococcales bacterium]
MSEPAEIHALEPEAFEERVHSFQFWFEAVQGYLADREYGHRPDVEEAPLSDADRDRLVTVLCNYCVGETAALDGASGLVAAAPNRLTKIFLATQVVDEGRHLEVLRHRLLELGVERPEEEIARRTSPRLRDFRSRLQALVERRDWEAAIFAQNVILEAMEFSTFHMHAQYADPITREVLQGIIKDERRHIGFGERELGQRLKRHPTLRDRLSRVRSELDPLVLATFEDAMDEIQVPRAERADLGRSYLHAVERLGVGVAT